MTLYILLFTTLCSLNNAAVKKVSPIEKTAAYWLQDGELSIQKVLAQKDNTNIAKNVILFIGDGMGPATVAATRAYKNQQIANAQEPDIGLIFEDFPNTAVLKTHSVEDYVAESSSTATAIVTGIKTNSELVGVGPEVQFQDCESHDPRYNLENIATMLHKMGKSIGIVTTTRITHATPSVIYAHTASRRWEANAPQNCRSQDIATQLVDKSELFTVILAGGTSYFLPESEGGKRKDNINLLDKWKRKMKKYRSAFVKSENDLRNVDLINTEYLIGLFSDNHMDYDVHRTNQPSLETMTEVAIRLLSRNKNGFFLMVEGGRIDHAHHGNMAYLAILETMAFEKAIKRAMALTDVKDTLMNVEADHSHVFTFGSYAPREDDITKQNTKKSVKPLDGKGHTSLLYSNGPGYKIPRVNVSDNTAIAPEFIYNSGVPLRSETHGGEDVPVYSRGPWSHLFKGVQQQSYVGHVMMYATCAGPYKTRPGC